MTLQQLQVSLKRFFQNGRFDKKKTILKLYALGATFCEIVCEIEMGISLRFYLCYQPLYSFSFHLGSN